MEEDKNNEMSDETRAILDNYWKKNCDKQGGIRKCDGCDNMGCANSYREILACMKKKGYVTKDRLKLEIKDYRGVFD